MACTAPEQYYKRDPALFSGVRGLTKDARKALVGGALITVACGKCMDCRLALAREWSLRIMHETKMSGPSSFVTLTYDNENLPYDYGLHYRDFQLFMHKLRKRLSGAGRFVACGEYGDQFGRPHFHAILFNCDFSDRKFWKLSPKGDKLYTSDVLSDLWGKGHCSVGDVTLESAGYVARYTTKKVTGDLAPLAYEWTSPDGEVFDREPPMLKCSLKPGIGYSWFERYRSDCFPCDFLVYDGRRFPVPRYYSDLLAKWDDPAFQLVKRERLLSARTRKAHPDYSARRLRDRNEVRNLLSANKRDLS